MLKQHNQPELDLSAYTGLYDILIAEDNFWRQLNELVDFDFIYDEVQKNYSATMGRPAEDPIRMIKYMLLKSAMRLSDRDLITKTRVDMEMKYFLGYAPEELEFIDASSLSKFRHIRLVDINLLDMLIQRTVEIALENNIISVKNILIQDSTHSNAMFQHISPREELIKRAKELRKAVYSVSPKTKEIMPKKREASGLLEDTIDYCKELIDTIESKGTFGECVDVMQRMDYLREGLEDTEVELEYSKDQDAKVGHKTADTSFFGYKTHISMTPERIITAATITSGEKHDGKEMKALVEKSMKAGIEVEAIVGDGAYSEKDNIEYAKENGIKLASKLSKTVTHGLRSKDREFEYNKDAGMYVCPAGHMAVRKAKGGCVTKEGEDQRVESYYFDIEKCKRCPIKDGCYKKGAKSKTYSVKIKSDIHNEHMDYMETEEFSTLYKERYKIEAKNAELKQCYKYETAQSCGILGMNIQGATTMFIANMKRILKLKGINL